MDDLRHMRHAIRLAARGLGNVAPNPSVGCVLLRDGQVIAAAHTQPGGRPHAEAAALAQAGDAARGATAYVTLEPCAHRDTTPSCADLLIAAGVARVVVALVDPDPRTAGAGIARMRAAGIAVTEGIGEVDARALSAGFLKRLAQGLPWVALKLATSADGMIADADGRSQWITGIRARERGHRLRAEHDAILTGIGTALADDPMLTCRLPGLEDRSPRRVILDSTLRLSPGSRLARSAREVPVTVFTLRDAPAASEAALAARGVVVERLPDLAPGTVLRRLAACGTTRLLVEAGPRVTTGFLPHADRLYWFRAPFAIGSGGRPAFTPMPGPLDARIRWRCAREPICGEDRLEVYDTAPA